MSKARPVIQDSMELAIRINDSTDIVTDLTDVVQNELPQKALQGDNPEATNSEILKAIDNIDTKLVTLNGYFDDVTYENVMKELNSDKDDA